MGLHQEKNKKNILKAATSTIKPPNQTKNPTSNSMDTRTQLLSIPREINVLGGMVYKTSTINSTQDSWLQIKKKCSIIITQLVTFLSEPNQPHVCFQPSEIQEIFKSFIHDTTPTFDSVRCHLAPSSLVRNVENAYIEAQAVLLLQTAEEQRNRIQCLCDKMKAFEQIATFKMASAEYIASSRDDIRAKLIAMPNMILETANMIQQVKDKKTWYDIGMKVQDIMAIALYLHTASTQLTFSAITGIKQSTTKEFDAQSVPEFGFVLTVLQDAWQTAKELLTLNPPKQRAAFSRVYSRMDRISAAIQPYFNHAMALKRAAELKKERDVNRKRALEGVEVIDVEEEHTKKQKTEPSVTPPPVPVLHKHEAELVDRCYSFLKKTGIWRIGTDHDTAPCFNNTLLESTLIVVMVRMRVTCARLYTGECSPLVDQGVAELFPDAKPESVAKVTPEMWAEFDQDVNAMCLRVM